MIGALRHFSNFFETRSEEDKDLITAVHNIVGRKPHNISLYRLAIRHTSIATKNDAGFRESNERLEYLGDAILGAVVADFLFKKYPFKDEGFLTEIRSRLVSRDSLNNLARRVGIDAIVQYDQRRDRMSHKSLYGDTLEALVGAVYLDRGYRFCRRFIIRKLIVPHFNLKEVVSSERNFKSKLIEWAQRENKEVRFEILQVKSGKNHKEFTAQVFIEDTPLGTGFGLNKKKAEQDAAQKSCELLKINT